MSWLLAPHPRQRVGSAHTRLAIELRVFGHAERAWGQPAACAKARRAKGAPRMQVSRLAKDEARLGACEAPRGGLPPGPRVVLAYACVGFLLSYAAYAQHTRRAKNRGFLK